MLKILNDTDCQNQRLFKDASLVLKKFLLYFILSVFSG